VFFNLNECLTNDEMIKIAETVLPLLSKHSDSIMMNPKLFERIDYVYQHRNEMGLDDQQIRVVEKYEQDFVRNGAALPADKQAELSQINEQLSTLSLQFGNNLLKENAGFKLVIENKEDLAGLPQTSIDAAAEQAKNDSLEGKWVFTLSKPSLIPFLQFSERRDLREQMYKAYYNRGDNNNEYDNKKLINEMVKLRVQKAKLFGYDNYADYVLAVNMAKDSKTVDKFLIDIFNPAQQLAKKELAEMQAIADGLVVLRRETPQGQIRLRRKPNQALPHRRQRAQRHVYGCQQVVWRHLYTKHQLARLLSRCGDLRSEGSQR